jgi:hypothetical protein
VFLGGCIINLWLPVLLYLCRTWSFFLKKSDHEPPIWFEGIIISLVIELQLQLITSSRNINDVINIEVEHGDRL